MELWQPQPALQTDETVKVLIGLAVRTLQPTKLLATKQSWLDAGGVDYKIWGTMQERVYCVEDQIQVYVHERQERIVDRRDKLDG